MVRVPDGWTRCCIDDVAEVTSGGTPDRGVTGYWGGGVPWISTGEINFNTIYASREYITEAGLRQSSAKLLPPDTVLMAMYGQGLTRGRVAILGLEAAVNQNCAAIIVTVDQLPRYIYYYLEFNYLHVRSLSHFGGQKHLNNTIVRTIELLLPPLSEQRKIAAILSTWDQAIGTVEQFIAALQVRKRGLMHQLLTGKARLKNLETEPWTTVKAGDIFQPFSKRKNDDVELLSVTQDRGIIPRSMLEARVVMPEGATDGYKLVEQGDFIISLRSFQGGIEYSEYRGIVSPAYTVLKPKVDIVDGYYKQIFKSAEFISRLGVAIIGIRDGKQINFDDFANIKLPYPSITEQRRIAQVFATADAEIALCRCKLKLLRQQKQGLMQRLLTGQVRVRVDEEQE